MFRRQIEVVSAATYDTWDMEPGPIKLIKVWRTIVWTKISKNNAILIWTFQSMAGAVKAFVRPKATKKKVRDCYGNPK